VTADPRMRSPLAHRADDLERVAGLTDGAVHARELVGWTQLDLRLDATAVDRSVVELPREPNTASGTALWLGPDEWLVLGVPGTAEALRRDLDAGLAGLHRSVVDVSAARAIVELEGPGRHDLLAGGCPIDLHPRAWGPGRCAQTLYGRAQVLLQELEGRTRLFVRSSFADYLLDRLLADAAAR
jgi:sarcosine oxidase subunit gamma